MTGERVTNNTKGSDYVSRPKGYAAEEAKRAFLRELEHCMLDLGIGSKWYNVVPVKLTENGIYKIPLVASNMYVIGDAIVTVSGDDVTVTYETVHATPGSLNITSECVKWFKSTDEITEDFINNPTSDIAFGDTVSKSELGDVAYLFICNGVNYRLPITDNGTFLARYNHIHQTWKDYRAGLDALVAEPAAE